MENEKLVVLTGSAVTAARLITLRGALKLEILGMKHSRFSAYKIIKQEFGLKGNKQTVLLDFENRLKSLGVLK